jgi:hypothetical protein
MELQLLIDGHNPNTFVSHSPICSFYIGACYLIGHPDIVKFLPCFHCGRDCYMSGKERWRMKSDGWVSHAHDKHLLKVSIVARLCCLIIIRATSGRHSCT